MNVRTRIICPDCASPNIHAAHRGFSGGLALLGLILFGFVGLMIGAYFFGVGGVVYGILLGGIGFFSGFIGANDVEITCLSCGAKGSPGK